MIDGYGDPNKTSSFEEAINTLFSISYTLKFMIKKNEIENSDKAALDYVVRPLEGLWWADDMRDFEIVNKDKWKWTLMVAQPDFVHKKMIERAYEKALKKKSLLSYTQLSYQKYSEGLSAQIMYTGPFEEEAPSIQKIHQFIFDQDGIFSGKHHEIYVSDSRRTAPEKLKTILRQPFRLKK